MVSGARARRHASIGFRTQRAKAPSIRRPLSISPRHGRCGGRHGPDKGLRIWAATWAATWQGGRVGTCFLLFFTSFSLFGFDLASVLMGPLAPPYVGAPWGPRQLSKAMVINFQEISFQGEVCILPSPAPVPLGSQTPPPWGLLLSWISVLSCARWL